MDYLAVLRAGSHDARRLESTYRAACLAGEVDAFIAAVATCYAEAPDNLLYAAWHYRLEDRHKELERNPLAAWRIAIPLSIPCGLLFWLLSDFETFYIGNDFPLLPLIAAPIAACFVMGFLSLSTGQRFHRLALIGGGFAVAVAYVLATARFLEGPELEQHYLEQMLFHLSLLAWAGIGAYVLGGQDTPGQRFAFLIKSLETLITGGLFLIAGSVFSAITFALFQALSIEPPEYIMRLFAAGGAGLIPVLALAAVYAPELSPLAQSFSQGISRLIATIMRLLLPLTLCVLVVYCLFIPFNFWEPFQNREVLIVYNAMLFAVMGLLLGATPVHASDLPAIQGFWLRRGVIAVAALAGVVSLYALAAVLYRTWQGGWTPNRFTVIGWNAVNIVVLALLLYKQWRTPSTGWVAAVQETVSLATNLYIIWGIAVLLAIPWLF